MIAERRGGIVGETTGYRGSRHPSDDHDRTVDRYTPTTGVWKSELRTPVRQWSIDGPWLVYQPAQAEPSGDFTIVIRKHATGTDRVLADDIDPDAQLSGVLAVGPGDLEINRRWFLLADAREVVPPDGTRVSLDANGGEPVPLGTRETSRYQMAQDGRVLNFGDLEDIVYITDPAAGERAVYRARWR